MPDMTNSATFTRRTLLVAAGGGAIAAALAACAPGRSPAPVASTPATNAWTPPAEPMRFPKGFTWGTATSAYQVEGSPHADGRTQSIWDVFCERPGAVKGGADGDPAADQYRRYAHDIELMAGLGVGAYRFSISWPRIIPDASGAVNAAAVRHYRRMLDALTARGIRPAITLFHWDLPTWVEEAGGWRSRTTTERFVEYANACFDAFGDVDADWMTFNEPKTHAFVGHWYGTHAPGMRLPDAAAAAVHHQLLAHGLAVKAFRERKAPGRIGIALNLLPAYSIDPVDVKGTARVDASENRLFLDPVLLGTYPADAIGDAPGQLPADPAQFAALQQPGDLATISAPMDFLAVQYYGVTGVDAIGNQVAIAPTSAASWQQIKAEGLYDLLTRLVADYPSIPILLTENGIPDPTADLTTDDPPRIDFLRAHFQQAARAIGEGVPLEAYYVWSLVDNFEWAEGYTQRWGIVAVDFDTQKRTLKRSARWYKQVIAANAVAPAH